MCKLVPDDGRERQGTHTLEYDLLLSGRPQDIVNTTLEWHNDYMTYEEVQEQFYLQCKEPGEAEWSNIAWPDYGEAIECPGSTWLRVKPKESLFTRVGVRFWHRG